MARLSHGIYSPLPQSLSDSDSEKDITVVPISCIQQGHISNGNSRVINSSFGNGQIVHRIRPDDNLLEIQTATSTFSTIRKLVLIVSILACFLPVVLFLWVVPCSDINACSTTSSNWKNELINVELLGSVNLIHGMNNKILNLAISYRPNRYIPEKLGHGVVAFLGRGGAIAWNFRQEILPKKLNCSLIDVNQNGIYDCLLLDGKGLKVLGTMSGEILWHVHSNEEGKTICDLGFPIKIIDLNNDGVSELLMTYKNETLLIVCGRSGRALNSFKVPCPDVDNLQCVDSKFIQYSCYNRSETYEFHINELIKKYRNQSSDMRPRLKHAYNNHEKSFQAFGKRITVVTNGRYPKCTVKMTLFDELSNNELSSWTFIDAYVTNLEQFSMTDSIPEAYINGFIFKLWQWQDTAARKKHNCLQDDAILNRTCVIKTVLEYTYLIASTTNNSFNMFNVSVTEITQFCFLQENRLICQPDIINQKDSVLINDLGMNDEIKLISYSSSFRSIQEHKQNWQLVSTISVTNLEQELQKVLLHKK